MLGSVAEKVLHAAPMPVLVLRGKLGLTGSLCRSTVSPWLSALCARPSIWPDRRRRRDFLLRAIQPVPLTDLGTLNQAERGLGQRYTEELIREAQDISTSQREQTRAPRIEMHAVVTPEARPITILRYTTMSTTSISSSCPRRPHRRLA